MSRVDCPCGFPPMWGMPWGEWHERHAVAHLRAFPNVDDGTRRVLLELAKGATQWRADMGLTP